MHPDLVTLLEADDEAIRLVAEAERQLQARLRAAREERETRLARWQQEQQQSTDTLIQTIESTAHQQTAERLAAHERRRQAWRLGAERVQAVGVDAYVAVVSGRPRQSAGEP